MAEATKQAETTPQPNNNNNNNPFVFLCNIPQFLLNSLANFKKKFDEKRALESDKSVKKAVVVVDDKKGDVIVAKSPDVVRFPLVKKEVDPIKVEGNDVVKEDTNPIILWQVYALGGFIVLKWAWGKWQERKANAEAKDDSPEEDEPPADD